METYFIKCEACGVYEYDCFGLEGCIRNDPRYMTPGQRHKVRQEREARMVELVARNNAPLFEAVALIHVEVDE